MDSRGLIFIFLFFSFQPVESLINPMARRKIITHESEASWLKMRLSGCDVSAMQFLRGNLFSSRRTCSGHAGPGCFFSLIGPSGGEMGDVDGPLIPSGVDEGHVVRGQGHFPQKPCGNWIPSAPAAWLCRNHAVIVLDPLQLLSKFLINCLAHAN